MELTRLVYNNTFPGEVDNFSRKEIITQDGQVTHTAKDIGGLIDQRKYNLT